MLIPAYLEIFIYKSLLKRGIFFEINLNRVPLKFNPNISKIYNYKYQLNSQKQVFSNNTMPCQRFNTDMQAITEKDFYKKFLRIR